MTLALHPDYDGIGDVSLSNSEHDPRTLRVFVKVDSRDALSGFYEKCYI